MTQTQKKLKPILIQDQETLRLIQEVMEEIESRDPNYRSIPKTWTVHNLVQEGRIAFLARNDTD